MQRLCTAKEEEWVRNWYTLLQDNNKDNKCNDYSNAGFDYQMSNKNLEKVNAIKEHIVEKHYVDNAMIDALDRLLGESFKARVHAEKTCGEKEYQLRSTKAYARELEEGLELLDDNDSSISSGVEDKEDFYQEEEEIDENNNKDLVEEHA